MITYVIIIIVIVFAVKDLVWGQSDTQSVVVNDTVRWESCHVGCAITKWWLKKVSTTRHLRTKSVSRARKARGNECLLAAEAKSNNWNDAQQAKQKMMPIRPKTVSQLGSVKTNKWLWKLSLIKLIMRMLKAESRECKGYGKNEAVTCMKEREKEWKLEKEVKRKRPTEVWLESGCGERPCET